MDAGNSVSAFVNFAASVSPLPGEGSTESSITRPGYRDAGEDADYGAK
jgi:hypothetical protein